METIVVKEALPLYLKGSHNKAVLIIHGFTGYPGEFYPLGEKLNQLGYTVLIPRLPGHGTNRKDFQKTGARDWLRHVEECYRDLRAAHEGVSLVGLSMGGVLALILAARYKPERTVLLAPAMAACNRLFYLTPLLRFFIPRIKSEWKEEKDDSKDRKILGPEYWTVDIPAQLAELRKLQKIALREIKKISRPLLLMLSEKDASVPLRASKIIKDRLNPACPVKEIILKESHHVLVTGCEKDLVNQSIAQWLEEKE
ncbi:MAG: alpha/beta fold hydrolase [Spirochaetales bacterium]|nr:alpha/beta fold hydrolase [Spirochaetales bacterium]